jgi:hypothetical protein
MGLSPLRAAAALAGVAALVAGCGSSGSPAPKPRNHLTIAIESFGASDELSVPPSVNSGVVQMKFENQTSKPHSAQIVRMDPGHDPLSAIHAGNAWAQGGKPLPHWLHLAGGFGETKPGDTLPGAGKFIPGNYAVIDTVSHGKPIYATFAVKGQPGSDQLPSSPSDVKAVDYSFSARGLRPGASFLFENRGHQPHEMTAVRLKPGATVAQVKSYVKSQKGKSPVDQSSSASTGILDAGASQLTTLNLKSGRYALLCFVPDRRGGPPHALKGMVGQVDVR